MQCWWWALQISPAWAVREGYQYFLHRHTHSPWAPPSHSWQAENRLTKELWLSQLKAGRTRLSPVLGSVSGAHLVLLKLGDISSKVGSKPGQLEVALALDNYCLREASGEPGGWRRQQPLSLRRCRAKGRGRRETKWKRDSLGLLKHDFESCHSGCSPWTKSDSLVKTGHKVYLQVSVQFEWQVRTSQKQKTKAFFLKGSCRQ